VSERPWPFEHVDEVRFSDLDTMRHLNNVAFLDFFESARVAYLADRWTDHDPGHPAEVGVVVVQVAFSYRAPGHYGDRVHTLLRPTTLGRTSFGCACEMRVGDRVIAEGSCVLVTVELASGAPLAVPDELRATLLADGATAS
jgi:acyl-CoA thioester hydrolase